MSDIKSIAKLAKEASYKLASISTDVKNSALETIAMKLEENTSLIFEANAKDLQEAKQLVEKGEITAATYA